MPVMDEADFEHMKRIVLLHGKLGMAQDPSRRRQRTEGFLKLCREAWVKDDSPDFLVNLVLDARMLAEAAAGRNWFAKVWPLTKPRIDPIWLERHARERLQALARPDAPLANCRDPRIRLALMVEDEARRAALDERAEARARRRKGTVAR